MTVLTERTSTRTLLTSLTSYFEGDVNTWQLQEAKSRFSEVVDLALKEGAQMVTRRGEEAVVVLSAAEYHRLRGEGPDLIACLLNAPRGKPLDIDRSSERIRDISL